ncbi:HAMP domain-containing protein [Deinococcus yavapaiensis]|uniref:histidine kinase n=1 Tax=Deinococcus yavapaiensis KR-236 TaxID=694435 RepID=A0A318SEP9_9DEIO|nr:HAMP domain-containing protein [Deinococcus yavapaiensis]PYE55715.1 HAMP domain-containing protein [Deinococcus yavapaiensis KR-236]
MKYTVVLARSVPIDLRVELADRLTNQFGLPAEQSQKLVSRKAGRLLKPTTKGRAEKLLGVYQALNLPVTLEEVADDDVTSTAATSFPTMPAPSAPSASIASASSAAVFAPAASAVVAEPVTTADVMPPAAIALAEPPPPAATFASPVVPVMAAPSISDVGAAVPAVTQTPTVERTFTDDVPAEAAPETKQRRFPLRQRVLLTALVPLAVYAVVTSIGSGLNTRQVTNQISRDAAAALAASVGTSVNIDDVNQLDTQLRALLQQPSVGFIAVNTPDGLQFFRSKNEDADFLLGEKVNQFIEVNPGESTYTYNDRPADRYKLQLQQLKDSGVDTGDAAKLLEQRINAPENQRVMTTHYEVQNIGVYERDGSRVAGSAKPAPGQTPLFTVAVGVITNEVVNATSRALWLNILAVAIMGALAVLLAVFTARRIVQPIEELVQAADKISLGQLDTPVKVGRNDEIGDLARALERMRLSLESAMERLRQRRRRA